MLAAGCLFLPDESVENRGREPLRIESVNVAEGETGLPLNVTIDVRFNQPLDPSSLDRASLSLSSGELDVAADVRFDALTRTLSFDPRSELRPDLYYEFEMDGFPLSIMGTSYQGEPLRIRFRTGTGTVPELPQRGVDFGADVWPIIGEGGCGCHGESARAMEFVVHDEPDEFLARSVGTESREWPGWLIVDPGRHESSYLLFKLLGDERLGMPTIMGEVMPPGEPLSPEEIALVKDWIEQGAGP
jgi:hypothetical protein